MLRIKNLHTLEQVLPIFVLALLCLAAWLLKLPDINWTIALTGWSAIDWVAHMTHPENFVRDFLNGSELYDKSSFMHVYPLAQQWLGISPETLIPVVILFEIVFLAGCGFYFFRAIAPKAPIAAACIFSVLLISSSARDMDLSNFGAPFFWGLYYNAADGLRLLGIALLFRGKVLTSALLLAASLTIHPLMALTACAFAFGFLLVERRIAEPRRLVLGAVLFSTVALAWWIAKFGNADVSSGAIDAQVWIDMARTFNYHFFPVDYGTLTIEHNTRILPLLSLVALATFYLPKICEDDRRCKAIISGLLLLGVLVVAGLLVSVYVPVPALIKLSLPRASAVIILVALAISVAGLVGEVLSSSPLRRALAGAVLLSPFFMTPGFPALPILFLILSGSIGQSDETRPWLLRKIPVLLSLFLVLFAVIFMVLGFIQLKHYAAYIGDPSFWLIVAVFALLNFFISCKHKKNSPRSFLLSALLVLIVLFSFTWQYAQLPSNSYRKLGKDYLEAQLWASKNTSINSLFMVDPTIYYGWRDFSSRSSFGNLREWLHTSWLYDSREESYTEGMKRFNELGIEITPYLHMNPASRLAGFNKLHGDVLKRLYDLNPKWFLSMVDKYGVDYLVLSKQAIHQAYPFKLEFENDSFIIYNLRADFPK
ncbi:MAG: hypothetical protein WC009_11190 [Methylotenera sp.]